VEAAFALPILVTLVISGVELGRYLLLQQKVQNAAMNVADLAARDETLSVTQLDDIFAAAGFVTRPFDLSAEGKVIVTGVSAIVDNTPLVFWQRAGGGPNPAPSQIGAPGNPAVIPATLPIRADETIIVAEVFFDFEPIFGFLLGQQTIRHVAYFRPRLGTLQALDP